MAADPITPPAEIGGYRVVGEPTAGRTFVADAPGGRRVVLKVLDPDCLLKGQLHPSIRERLARVRELALKDVANLHGVERNGDGVYLVWDYVPGTPIGALEAGAAGLSGRELVALARELVLTVESLHAAGIVHGAIGPGNVIVDPHRRPRLTHVSPLLYTDPARDAAAVVDLLRTTVARLGAADAAGWDEALAGAEHVPLRELGTRLAGLKDGQEPTAPPAPAPPPLPAPAPRTTARPEPARPGPWHRFWSLLAAAAAAAAGLAIFLGVWWYTTGGMTNDQVPMANEVPRTNDQ